ncbi:PREDICTED: protein FAM228B [Sturnus vulgaris]|uniref:protein FAM228B n=1 Tax=Sturnus vulgaris TaxID=9172 RepID=UPI00071A69B0|nr:PREDICTED: protein FAM228B [Sturnus vulgaris]
MERIGQCKDEQKSKVERGSLIAPARLGSARFGSAGLDRARLGAVRPSSAQLGSTEPSSLLIGSLTARSLSDWWGALPPGSRVPVPAGGIASSRQAEGDGDSPQHQQSGAAHNFNCSRHFGKENIAKDWLTQKEGLLLREAPDQSRNIIASVQCILDRENFVRELGRYLRHSDFLNLRKKELLYKKYIEDVSEPFMQKMKDRMDSQSQEEMQKRRREQLSQYLNYCTKKGYVFLDDYDPSEYDPFFQKTCTDWKDGSR